MEWFGGAKKCQTASVDTLGNRTPMTELAVPCANQLAKYPLDLADNPPLIIRLIKPLNNT